MSCDAKLNRAEFGWTSLVSDEEAILLVQLAADTALPEGHIIEVGVNLGGTLSILAEANRARGRANERVVGIDSYIAGAHDCMRAFTATTDMSLFAAHRLLAGASAAQAQEAVLLIGTTETMTDLRCGQSFRLAFLDGDHTPDQLALDIHAVSACMVTGGVMVVHDIALPELAPMWENIASQNGVQSGDAWLRVVPYQPNSVGVLVVERGDSA